jgi:hypothetical protein
MVNRLLMVLGLVLGVAVAVHTGKPLAALLSFSDDLLIGIVWVIKVKVL